MTMLTNKKRLLNEVMPVKRVSTFQKLEDHAYESKSNCISMTEKILQWQGQVQSTYARVTQFITYHM